MSFLFESWSTSLHFSCVITPNQTIYIYRKVQAKCRLKNRICHSQFLYYNTAPNRCLWIRVITAVMRCFA